MSLETLDTPRLPSGFGFRVEAGTKEDGSVRNCRLSVVSPAGNAATVACGSNLRGLDLIDRVAALSTDDVRLSLVDFSSSGGVCVKLLAGRIPGTDVWATDTSRTGSVSEIDYLLGGDGAKRLSLFVLHRDDEVAFQQLADMESAVESDMVFAGEMYYADPEGDIA